MKAVKKDRKRKRKTITVGAPIDPHEAPAKDTYIATTSIRERGGVACLYTVVAGETATTSDIATNA